MRATTLLNRLLALAGIRVLGVSVAGDTVVVDVGLRRRKLVCPLCEFSTSNRHDTRRVESSWRHLDLGRWRVLLRARLRRVCCPTHGVRVEGVPFARHRSGFTRDFEDLAAYLATKTDKTAICRLLRIDWDTVGRIGERVVADGLDPDRLDGLVEIGVDEVSWKRQHNYITLVTDHRRGRIVWGAEGKDTATMNAFFADLGAKRAAQLEAVSMDMGPAYAKSVAGSKDGKTKGHAPQATICIDPYHAVAKVTEALDKVRRKEWNKLRKIDPDKARKFKGARWVLLKRATKLTDDQQATLRKFRRRGGIIWRAYRLSEAFRAIFAGDLSADQTEELLDRWISKASRSGIDEFVKVARTIRTHRDGILAAIGLGINNGRAEGLNNIVRLITRRAFGFHSAGAALGLIMLTCGPIKLVLPHERSP
ncbi:MAG: ISL3 family transposase [Gemmatimonas sp.]|nr:ISL3 family transposase [Gemmatimonas sp.]